MEIVEIVEKITSIKSSIDEAFENGLLDLDQVSTELDSIRSALQKASSGSSVSDNEILLRRENQLRRPPFRQLLKVDDYK